MSDVEKDKLVAVLTLALEKLLHTQLERHRALLDCLERKRDAIRTADLDAITTLCKKETTLVQRLTDLETKRGQLIDKLTALLHPDSAEPLTVAAVAELVDEPRRGVLLATAQQLREIVPAVRHQSSIVRAAADSLSRHMSGLMQSVRTTLSQAGVYGRRGALADATPMHLSVDLRS